MRFLAVLPAFLCGLALLAPGTGTADERADYVTALNESNIDHFLKEVRDISTGQRPDLSDEDVADYLNNHVADKSLFSSTIHYEIPGFPNQDSTMELNKEDYIGSIIQGRFLLEDYHATIEVRNLKIGHGGKNASFTSVTKERGKMPWIKDPDHKNDIEMIPIQGESTCEQKLAVSFNHFIQMVRAECTSSISFDPFAGKPLIPE